MNMHEQAGELGHDIAHQSYFLDVVLIVLSIQFSDGHFFSCSLYILVRQNPLVLIQNGDIFLVKAFHKEAMADRTRVIGVQGDVESVMQSVLITNMTHLL